MVAGADKQPPIVLEGGGEASRREHNALSLESLFFFSFFFVFFFELCSNTFAQGKKKRNLSFFSLPLDASSPSRGDQGRKQSKRRRYGTHLSPVSFVSPRRAEKNEKDRRPRKKKRRRRSQGIASVAPRNRKAPRRNPAPAFICAGSRSVAAAEEARSDAQEVASDPEKSRRPFHNDEENAFVVVVGGSSSSSIVVQRQFVFVFATPQGPARALFCLQTGT